MNLLSYLRPKDEASGPGVRTEPDAVFYAPWSWRDEDGLYVSEAGHGWLYRDITAAAARAEDPAAALDDFFAALAGEEGDAGREVHLLATVRQEPAALPPNPTALRELQAAELAMLVPHRNLLLGVRLRTAGAKGRVTLRDALRAEVIAFLGEAVPDFSAFDKDREAVAKLLAAHGAEPVPPAATASAEGWMTYGAGPDLYFDERADACYLTTGERLEAVAVAGFDPRPARPSAQLLHDAAPSPTQVYSVRGVARRPGQGSRLRQPFLDSVSIVIARRVPQRRELLVDELINLPGVVIKPLPHRQLRAIEETLPGAAGKVSPYLKEVTGAKLTAAGVVSGARTGDQAGAYLGFTRPDAQLTFLDLSPAASITGPVVIAGDGAHQRTSVAASLGVQYATAGANVVVLAHADQATAYSGLGPTVPASAALSPGVADPFRSLDPDTATHICLYLLAEAGGDGYFTSADQERLLAAGKRARVLGAPSAHGLLQSVAPETLAKIESLAGRHAAVAAVFHPAPHIAPGGSPLDGRSSVIVEATGADVATYRFLARTSIAVSARGVGSLAVLDGPDMLMDAPDAAAWLSGSRYATARVILCGRPAQLRQATETVAGYGPRLVLGTDDPMAGASLLGIREDKALAGWWADRAAGDRPLAAGLLRDQSGHVSVLTAAPLIRP